MDMLIEDIFRSLLPGSTVVELRTHTTPMKRWRAVVHYDHWGSPFIRGGLLVPNVSDITLLADGATDDYRFCGTRWKHVGGPAVKFGTKPADQFSDWAGS